MGFKMKNPISNIAATKSHGTNKNYQMSGMTNADGTAGGPPFLKGLGKKIGRVAGNFAKGKGAFGLLNPIGAIASRLGAFGKKPDPNATAAAAGAEAGAAMPVATAAPTAAPAVPADEQAGPVVDPNAVDPNAQVA